MARRKGKGGGRGPRKPRTPPCLPGCKAHLHVAGCPNAPAAARKAQEPAQPAPKLPTDPELSERHLLFCYAYLETGNATEAYRRVYPGNKNPDVDGPRLLGNGGIQAFLAPRRRQRAERLKLVVEELDSDLAAAAGFDPLDILDDAGDVRPLGEWPERARRVLGGMDVEEIREDGKVVGRVRKVRWLNKLDAIRLGYQRLGKLVEKHDLTVRNVSISFGTAEGRAKLKGGPA